MTINAGDIGGYVLKSGKRDRLQLQARATVGGALGVLTQPLTFLDDPGITIVRGASAGLYTITFPKGADAQGSLDVALISPAGTVKSFYVVALDLAAGTASVQTSNAAGAATDPTVNDSFIITLWLSTRRDL